MALYELLKPTLLLKKFQSFGILRSDSNRFYKKAKQKTYATRKEYLKNLLPKVSFDKIVFLI